MQVEVIMPATWNVKESHDVALTLQHKVRLARACHHLLLIVQSQGHPRQQGLPSMTFLLENLHHVLMQQCAAAG